MGRCVNSRYRRIEDVEFCSLSELSTTMKSTVIRNHVLVGFKSIIFKGFKVNNGAIIASRNVVSSDVLAKTLVSGNPTRVLTENINWK